MAQIDHTILRGAPVPVPPNSLGSLGRIEAIGQLVQRDREAKEQREAEALLSQIGSQYADDPYGAVTELRRRGFAKQANEYEKHLVEQGTKLAQMRKTQLETEELRLKNSGQLPSQKMEAEKQFLAQADPQKWAQWIAVAETDDDLANAMGAAKMLLGERGAPLLATVPKTVQEAKVWAQNVVMGPGKVADVANQRVDNERAAAADAAAQADRVADNTRADKQLEQTTAYQSGMLGVARQNAAANTRRAAQAGATGATGGNISASDKALVEAVLKQPAMFKSLTPTVKSRIGAALAERGFQFEQMGSGGGRGITSGDAGRIAEFDTSLDDVSVLRETLTGPGSTGAQSKVGAMLPNVVTELTGWGEGAKQRQAQIDRVKQVIGKALEGGVLRAEDEKKYVKILPTIGDPPEVVKTKLKGLEDAIKLRRERLIESLNDAGYDTSRYESRQPRTLSGQERLTKEIPGFPGSLAESSDGGKTWKRIK